MFLHISAVVYAWRSTHGIPVVQLCGRNIAVITIHCIQWVYVTWSIWLLKNFDHVTTPQSLCAVLMQQYVMHAKAMYTRHQIYHFVRIRNRELKDLELCKNSRCKKNHKLGEQKWAMQITSHPTSYFLWCDNIITSSHHTTDDCSFIACYSSRQLRYI